MLFPRARKVLLPIVALTIALAGCRQRDEPADAATDPLSFLSGPSEEGFERAMSPRPFVFPGDHASHPDFRSEWWYFTGNLEAENGRQLGFQITFFRFALAADSEPDGWGTRQLWLGQLAISDLTGDRYFAAERLSRELEGIAGSADAALDVRIEDWSISGDGELQAVSIVAADEDFGLDLELHALKARVLQGDRGLSQKGEAPGNASYYYTVPRLRASGTVRLPDGDLSAAGLAWFDREWSTSALEDDQAGWDWFALQLSDGTDVMVYRLRTAEGGMHPRSAGVIVGPDGAERHLGADELMLEPDAWWTSPVSGRRYPIGWRARFDDFDLTVEARTRAQEHTGRFQYWEGAVQVAGTRADEPVDGLGYLEMTGYE